MTKKSLYLLGLLTLLVFPLPTFIGLYFVEGIQWYTIFEFENLQLFAIALGLGLGSVYAIIALFLMKAPVFDEIPNRIESIVASMRLNIFDCIFISLCAGIGEELLFRSGVQFYLGPIITTVLFVAIHGYLNPWNWRVSLYGLIVLPFILLISYGYIYFGLWFAITAHAIYDFILFIAMSKGSNKKHHEILVQDNFESISLEDE